jgi:hypothetical protein
VSQPDFNDQPRSMVVQKPKSNIYTVLLGISALALVMGSVFLLLEITTYSQSFSPSAIYSAVGGPR